LDVNYAKAWCMCKFLFFFLIWLDTLGMAHLSRFFKNRINPKDLESS
jgi:hypothetical protein